MTALHRSASSADAPRAGRRGGFMAVMDACALGAMRTAEALVLLQVFMFTIEVVMRYLFASPSGLVDQVGGLAMTAITFLALAWTFKEGAHVNVDLLVNKLGPRRRRLVHVCTEIATVAVAAVLTWYSARVVIDSFEEQERFTMGSMTLPLYPFQIVMPLGLGFLTLYILCRLIATRGAPPPQDAHPAEF